MKSWLAMVALVSLALLGMPGGAWGSTRAARASQLYESARRRLQSGAHEERQFALNELKDAVALDPSRNDIALVLGRLYLEADLLSSARNLARSVLARDSTVAAAWQLAGEVWRRIWLTSVDETARERAIVYLSHSGRLDPRVSRVWLLLAPLLVDAGQIDAALWVTNLAVRAAPDDPEAKLSLAAASQRAGDLQTAERLFRSAVPRLPAKQRERYEDILPLLPPATAARYARLDAAARARYVERFWAEADPDPVSVENEARLEYWARLTQALFLYGPPSQDQWDQRALYYVRFGPPGYEQLDPIARPSWLRMGNWLSWTYPDLGMRAWMGSRSIYFGFPAVVAGFGELAYASPDSLARRGDLLPVHDGWAVFHRLPPGVTALDARVALGRFQTESGARVLAQVETAGTLDAPLAAEWVVIDSTHTVVERGRQPMSMSACRAGEALAAGFTASLGPGRYAIGVQVSDSLGHRGIVRRAVVTPPASKDLALSDLVVCGPPTVTRGPQVKLEPRTDLFPEDDDRLDVYFEIYNLMPSADGQATFEYHCLVRAVVPDRRGWWSRLFTTHEVPPLIDMSRSETMVGSTRRQFLRVPLGGLAGGRYEIALEVQDETSGAVAWTATTFERR